MTHKNKIIVAPLNWGLGHASRCVPIVRSLLEKHFIPILASDGEALSLLRKEFPELEYIQLPSYEISYGKNLKWSLFKKIPVVWKTAKKEHQILQQYIENNSDVVGVISDNRFGMNSTKLPSVYITHQINVLSGVFTPITSFFHQRIIKKFDECWIPDEVDSAFSGKLSSFKKKIHQKYIGVLSRFEKKEVEKTIDILIVLSGPEPNRSILEKKMIDFFSETDKRVWLVRGAIEEEQTIEQKGQLRIFNFMLSEELEEAMNSSKLIICRSGYSSVMDLVSLNKKAILIPTPGQTEQEYLGEFLEQKKRFRFVKEKELTKEKLQLKPYEYAYKGSEFDLSLFSLFQGK